MHKIFTLKTVNITKELFEKLNEWKDIPYSGTGKVNIVKISMLSELYVD